MTPPSGPRASVLEHVAEHVVATRPGRPARVAVDGITAAGKSTFAADLATVVHGRRPVLHVSADGFHHPRAHRRRNPDPAAGYYADAYDFAAVSAAMLRPLGAGVMTIRTAVLDLTCDTPLDEVREVPPDVVLIFDGTFLQRDLRDQWDVVVYLDVPFDIAWGRGRVRDAALFGSPEAADDAYLSRYHAACARYVAEVDPASSADIVIDNRDPSRPRVIR